MDEVNDRFKKEMDRFKERLEQKHCGVRKEVQKELETINNKLDQVIKTLDKVELDIKKIFEKIKL